uniref:Uncharacterized protein n=1 Tax=viral metagenome TaxID=1070528 RepID=A0A6C0I3H7_9ZZZZ
MSLVMTIYMIEAIAVFDTKKVKGDSQVLGDA